MRQFEEMSDMLVYLYTEQFSAPTDLFCYWLDKKCIKL